MIARRRIAHAQGQSSKRPSDLTHLAALRVCLEMRQGAHFKSAPTLTPTDANVAAWLNSVDDADLVISALTVREVRKGIAKLAAKEPDVAAHIEARVRDF